MKNTFKLTGNLNRAQRAKVHLLIIAFIAVIAFSFAACTGNDDGETTPSQVNPENPVITPGSTEAIYTSVDAETGNIYELKIIKAASASVNRAVYTPQAGDTFILTIKDSNGSVIGTSTGKVKTISESGSASSITLESGGNEFTVTVTSSTSVITAIDDDIPLTGGQTMDPPNTFTPGNLPASYFELYNNNNEYRIVRGTETPPNNVIIPAEYNGKPVTAIGSLDDISVIGVFENRANIISVQIPASVTVIGYRAFCGSFDYETQSYNMNLATVTFAAGSQLETVGSQSFQNCASLTSVTIPSNVTSIDRYAFSCLSVTSVTFQGVISENNLGFYVGEGEFGFYDSPFVGDLRDKYLAGGIGSYTMTSVQFEDEWGSYPDYVWTKQ
jgi:hypothetical protein